MSGDLVVFAGAGVSCPAPSSLPLFAELARKIGGSSSITMEKDEPEDRYLGRLKAKGVRVHNLAADILVNNETKPHELHHLLLQLFPTPKQVRLVTTNFDTHFTIAARESFDTDVEKFYAPALPLGNDFNGIVYLHGCADKKVEKCILTDEDFGRAYLSQGWATRFLISMFSRYVVLFVGYSHNDTVMNYLARGLPPGNQQARFAFSTDDDQSLSKWKHLEIQPLVYKPVEAKNLHEPITVAVRDWVSELKRGLWEKAERIRAIATSRPPLEGEDADYIQFSLTDASTAQFFFKHAILPEWISWLEKRNFLRPLFSPDAEMGTLEPALEMWLTDHFVAENSQELMASIQRNGGKLTPTMCGFICRRLGMRDRDDKINHVFGRWTAFLLAQSSDALSDEDWGLLLKTCRFPEDKAISVLLFDLLTRPKIVLEENWLRAVDKTNSEEVRFGLNLERHENCWLNEAWNHLIKANFISYVNELEPIVLNNLGAAHALLETCSRGNEEYDPFYLYRQSIGKTNENRSETVVDILLDAAASIVLTYAERNDNNLSILVEKCLASRVPVLRRIAVFGVGKRIDLSADEKLEWLLKNNLLYRFKTDVFELIECAYPNASDPVKETFIKAVLLGIPKNLAEGLSQDVIDYEVYNFVVWLRHVAPSSSITEKAYSELQKQHPNFRARKHPELDFYSGKVESYNPTEGFDLDLIASGNPEDFLDKLLNRQSTNPFERSRYCSAVTGVVVKKPEWGIFWISTLISRYLIDSDLWQCVCQGWCNGKLGSDQWKAVLEFSNTVDAPPEFFIAFANVLENGSRREENAIPDSMIELAERVAIRIWNLALKDTPPAVKNSKDWLQTAINQPGGHLAEFWLQRISVARKISLETWRGFPDSIKEALLAMIVGTSGSATYARILFASQLHYFYSLDPAFASERLLPLFDWKDELRAKQSWDGFLWWGRWLSGFTKSLLPSFDETIRRISQFSKNAKKRIIDNIVGIALFRLENPIENKWLQNKLEMLPETDREQVATRFGSFLRETAPMTTEKIWERWFNGYWKMRLNGLLIPLTEKEKSTMVGWPLGFEKYYPEAVELAISGGSNLNVDCSDLMYRINEKGFAKSQPEPTAKLVLYILNTRPQFFHLNDYNRQIWRDLKTGSVEISLLLDIRNAMVALGYDPESSS